MSKIKAIINNIKIKFSGFIEKTFSSKKSTFKFLALFVFTILFLLEISMILINNSFYNNASDDVLQYYTIIVDFIAGLKDGSISWFNLNNYFGASFFSDIYYIPIDIFTTITFSLSYLMPTEVAYSVTELIKIFIGVMAFAYYLSLNGMKNRTIFWMGIVYFIGGGTVSFMAFPVFLSLTVYMPIALLVIHYFFHKKRWIVPLFAFASIFYDFYLGYTILAFISFAYLIEYFKKPNFKFLQFIKDSVIFFMLILLGVVMSAVVAYPSIIYILEETYRSTGTFNAWIINIGSYELKLFQPNIYIRFVAKIFTEQKPIGFYGFENDYATEHISLYISIIGFAYMSYVFFMRDKISRIYKGAIIIGMLFMIFPLFSYVFSGTMDAPYTRWINMLPIFQVMILAHVFDKFGFEKVKMKYMTIIITFLLIVVGALIYYYIYRINHIVEPAYLASKEIIIADTVLLCVSALYLLIFLIFGWFKKWTVVKLFFWIEFIVAIGYIYSGPLSIRNKINTFENAHQIERFLDSNLNTDEFYRVYIDIDNLGVEDTNFNRMMSYATNTSIFHSWTDAETNEISKLLYGVNEYQSKDKMNNFGYYLNHFLGFKYVLVDAKSNYGLSPEIFELIASDSNYKLYEMNEASGFKVYESYMTYTNFISYRSSNSDLATEKLLLFSALLDSERYAVEDYNLEYNIPANDNLEGSIPIYTTLSQSTLVDVPGITDNTVRTFYKFTNEVLDITFPAGAVYFKVGGLTVSDYGEVYMEFADNSTQSCVIQPDQPHQVKCGDFGQTPIAIYIENTEGVYYAPVLKMRQEAAINRAAYLVFDLSGMSLDDNIDITKFHFNTSHDIEKAFVLDEQGNEYNLIDGFYSSNLKPDKLYVFKTNQLYEYTNIFSLIMKYSYDDLENVTTLLDKDFTENEYLSIKNGKINLNYTNLSDSAYDQMIMIPVAYSDDWKFIGDTTYETLSINGGFLGIVIPNGTEEISISMKFIPKGLDIGALASLGGVLIYLGIFIPYWKKKKTINGDDVE